MLVTKRNDAGRGGAQPDPGSMVDDCMPELRRGGRGARSRCCGNGGGVVAGEPSTSWRIRIECRCGNGSAFGMGSGAASQRDQSGEEVCSFFESHVLGPLSATTHQARRVGQASTWMFHAVWQNCKTSKVDAFSLSIPWRHRRSRACGSRGRSMTCAEFDAIGASSDRLQLIMRETWDGRASPQGS